MEHRNVHACQTTCARLLANLAEDSSFFGFNGAHSSNCKRDNSHKERGTMATTPPSTIDWTVVTNIAGPIIGVVLGAWVTHLMAQRPKLVRSSDMSRRPEQAL